MSAALIIAVISILLSVLTGLVVWVKNSRQKTDKVYLFTSLAYVLLGLFNFLSTGAEGEQKIVYARLVMACTATAIMSTYFLIVGLVKIPEKNNLQPLRIGIGIIAVVFSLTPFVIGGFINEGPRQILRFGWGMSLYGVLVGYFVYLITRELSDGFRRNHKPHIRAQSLYLLIGFLPVLFLAPITSMYLPAAEGDLRFIALTPVYSAFFVIMVGYAMVRHNLFDIRAFAVRAAAYSLTMLVLAILYVAPLIFVMVVILDINFSWWQFIFAVAIGTIGATNYSRLMLWFNRISNRIFFRDSYDPALILSELNKTLVSKINLRDLLDSSAEVLSKALKPEQCDFVLKDLESGKMHLVNRSSGDNTNIDANMIRRAFEHKQDNVIVATIPEGFYLSNESHGSYDIAAAARLVAVGRTKQDLLGYILFGSRKSGKPYDQQDIQVMSAAANTLVIAIQNALHFEEIQEFNKTLQARVEEQTRKYSAANERLKKLDETKDEFISMASHQLRTPLTSIKGYLSMVLEGDAGPLKPQQEQLLKQSFMSSQRMVNLIADLLNLSRLNTGKFVIDAAPTDLRVVVDQEVEQLNETAKAKNVHITYSAPKTFVLLPLDEGKMHQVVMNFLDNAIYYTPEKGHIEVALIETLTAVELRIKDNGIGVPREQHRHLFTKFYRADNARRMRPDGTGLGLYMAKKVIVAQGGSVIFESQEGKGSTFGFRFSKPSSI
ncbi:hypothetical protein IPL85_00125 [Candidatus Saccharibacteria bacterium]|nr:MAG: hypothetical protein IPL85_00125 [Candidatus Saccharibacteria bacterium]